MSKGMFSEVHDMLNGSTWTYDSGFYANDGKSDLFICFFYSSDGEQVAYLNNGHEDAIADYEVTEDELEDGTPLMLIRVGELVLGYMHDGTDWYIIDKDANVAVAAELTEEEAEFIFDAVQD